MSILSYSLPLCFQKYIGTFMHPSKAFLLLIFLDTGLLGYPRVDERTLNLAPQSKESGQ